MCKGLTFLQGRHAAILRLTERYNRPTSALEDTSRLKVRGWKKVFYANENQKKVEKQSILIDKIDCYERKMDNT